MLSAGFAINEIVVRVNEEVALCKAKLEVEESGRELARLQGNVAGYNRFLGFLSAVFGLSESMLESTGDKPIIIPELTDEGLQMLDLDIKRLKESEQWDQIQSRINKNTENLKSQLLFSAEKSRDLDICQGNYQATTFYTKLFSAVENEVQRRAKEEERRQKEPDLPFDSDNVLPFSRDEVELEEADV